MRGFPLCWQTPWSSPHLISQEWIEGGFAHLRNQVWDNEQVLSYLHTTASEYGAASQVLFSKPLAHGYPKICLHLKWYLPFPRASLPSIPLLPTARAPKCLFFASLSSKSYCNNNKDTTTKRANPGFCEWLLFCCLPNSNLISHCTQGEKVKRNKLLDLTLKEIQDLQTIFKQH